MDASEEGARALTDECPPPPFYWELGAALQPPALSVLEEEDKQVINEGEYGGLVRVLKRKRPFDHSKDYKAELRALLKTLLDRSMLIASTAPTSSQQQQQQQHEATIQLNQVLLEVHNTLGEYRVHEAREKIILACKAELHRVEEFLGALAQLETETQI